jgi:hypothetical protein
MAIADGAGYALVLATGLLLTGFATYYLYAIGAGVLGALAWAIGFTGVVVLAWYEWIRPLDLTGPGSARE